MRVTRSDGDDVADAFYLYGRGAEGMMAAKRSKDCAELTGSGTHLVKLGVGWGVSP